MNLNNERYNTSANLLGYYNVVKSTMDDDFKLAAIMPTKKIVGIDFSYVVGRNDLPAVLSPSAPDTEAVIRDRGGLDFARGELALFKNKKYLNETDSIALNTAVEIGKEDTIRLKLSEIFNDEKELVDSAIVTQEYLRARALFDGVITLDYDGGKVDVTYGYDSDKTSSNQNKYNLPTDNLVVNWDNPNANIIADITSWLDNREENTGIRPDSIVLNKTTFSYFKINSLITSYMNSLLKSISKDSDLIDFLKTSLNLKEVIIYNKKLEVNGTKVDLIEDNKVFLYSFDTNVGDLMMGSTPAEVNKNKIKSVVDVALTSDGIAVSKWVSVDPIKLFTGVEMVCLPSFPGIDNCVSAIVA